MKTFKSGNITLMNCDCMDYLKTLDDNAFDLAVCDVPYGIGENGSNNKSRSKLAKAKDYKPFAGGIDSDGQRESIGRHYGFYM